MALRSGHNTLDVIVIVCLALTSVFQTIWAGAATECESTPPTLKVGYKQQNFSSPGYPKHYSNNLDCMWILQAADNRSLGFGIQVFTIELQLDPDHEATTVDQCDSDYLELFEGTPSNLGKRVGIWCGSDRKALSSPNGTLTLKFHSNNHHTGKGFLVEYALVKLASPKCQPGNITPIYAGQAPIYVGLTVNSNESRCTWRIEAIYNNGMEDSGSILVVEAFSIPKLLCRDGQVVLFDGPNSLSPEVLRWCNGGEAFSVVFLSSSYATLTFAFNENQKFPSDSIQLKVYSQSRAFLQICFGSVLPEIQVNENPVYFHLPYTDISGKSCPVHVSQSDKNKQLRIDVMSVHGQLPTCESEVVSVKRGDNTSVEKSCNRHQYPMYLPQVAAAVVYSMERVLLRAISADPVCSGVVFRQIATTSLLLQDVVPKGFMHGSQTHNCISKYLITTERMNLVIALKLEWTLPQEQELHFTDSDVCQGDFVNIYNGNNESAPLLFSTCHKAEWPNNFVGTRIIGTSDSMLILFNSDDVADSNLVRFAFYAMHPNTECSKPHTITVTTSVQDLASPNYPNFYPLDYDCTYKLITKNPKDIIVIEEVDTKFSQSCDEIVQIYSGETGRSLKDYLGHICRHNKNKTFITNDRQIVIQFKPDKIGLVGRWKLKIYSQARASAGRSQPTNTNFIFVLLTFLVGCFKIKI